MKLLSSSENKARLALTFITVIWGSTFPLSKIVLEELPPFLYLFIRYTLAALIMLLLFRQKIFTGWRMAAKHSLPIGSILGLAYYGQTIGVSLTTAGKAGFLTGLSVVLVPLFQAIWFKKKPSKVSIICALSAALGLAFLSGLFNPSTNNVGFNFGDLCVLFSAIMFAIHILLIDNLPPDCPRESLVSQQFIYTALFALPLSIGFESIPTTMPSWNIWLIVLFLVLLATVLAFAVQVWAQQHLNAINTAIILILEPVFAAIFSWIWLNEQLGVIELIGAVLIVISMLGSSLDGENSPSS